ncbi:hypothetical protein GCM10027047_06260 [Rhodococcus aerolatus]
MSADAVTPFTLDVPQADLDDLAERLARTRWAGLLPGEQDLGVRPDALRELAGYWAHGYDWRVQEAWLNGFDQLTTTIDGQRVHALHVRSPEPDALPLVLSHGWPGSVVEFGDVLRPPTPVRTAATRPTRSTSSPRRCPATACRARRTAPGGTCAASPPRSRPSWPGWATTATAPRAGTGARPSPGSSRAWTPGTSSGST